MYNVKIIRNTQHWRQSGKNYIIVRIQTSMLQIELTFFFTFTYIHLHSLLLQLHLHAELVSSRLSMTGDDVG